MGSLNGINARSRYARIRITPISRREVVGTVGSAVDVAAVVEQQATRAQTKVEAAAQPMSDPRTKYLKPPFERQSQPWPGLASKMEPMADHGETSYRGRAGSRDARLSSRAAIAAWGVL